MSVIDIFLLILIIVAIVLGIYLIFSLKKINSTLNLVQEDINKLNTKLEPILERIEFISRLICFNRADAFSSTSAKGVIIELIFSAISF